MENKQRTCTYLEKCQPSHCCMTQTLEKLSTAGSNVTCILTHVPISKQFHLHPNKAKEQTIQFGINIINVAFFLYPLSQLTPERLLIPPSQHQNCSPTLLYPTATSQYSFYLSCHQYLIQIITPLLLKASCVCLASKTPTNLFWFSSFLTGCQ